MASIKDIAEKLNISKAAVSIYMKDPETKRIGKDTKEKIENAIREMNYRPNVIARSLSSQKTNSIGILIPYNEPVFQSTFVTEMLSGIQTSISPRGYSMVFPPTRGEDSPSMVKNQLLAGHGYDGYILFGTRYCSREDMIRNVEELQTLGIPFVVVNMPQLDHDISQVILRTPPSSSGVRYLIQLGHRKIVFLAGRPFAPDTIEGLKDYQDSLAAFGIPYDESLVLYGDYEKTATKSEMIQFLERKPDFSAVYTLTDTMALGAYDALAEFGYTIPDDVSLVGRNDSFFARFMNPPLTTVRLNIFEAGVKAAELLLRAVEHGEDGRKIFMDSELILRASAAVYPDCGDGSV